jgi:hypothetical protein
MFLLGLNLTLHPPFFILEIQFILKPLISTLIRPEFWGQFLDYLPLACCITYLA